MKCKTLIRGLCGVSVLSCTLGVTPAFGAAENDLFISEEQPLFMAEQGPTKEIKEEYEAKLERKRKLEATEDLAKYGIDTETLARDRLDVLAEGMDLRGIPYRYGGTTKRGFDCSGFTQYVFKNALGIDISRTSSTQPRSSKLKEIPLDEARPGDLVYRVGSHAMIFIANNDDGLIVLHSPRTGESVKIAPYHTRKVRAFRPVKYSEDADKKSDELLEKKKAEEEAEKAETGTKDVKDNEGADEEKGE